MVTEMNSLVRNTVNVFSDKELATVALEEFKEVPEKIAEDVATLQQWIKSSPHLENIRQDAEFLRMFHRGCNHSLEISKTKLDLFYSARANLPSWFDDWDPKLESVSRILNAGVYLPLRGFDKKGRYVILVRQQYADPALMTTDDCYKAFLMVFSLALEGNTQAYTKGYVMISDQDAVTTSHAMMIMTPGVMRKHTVVFQDSYPMDNEILIRNSRLFILNMPSLIERFFNMFLGYLDEKYKTMIKILPRGDYDTLKQEVGEDILPIEYGGTNGSVEEIKDFWKEEVIKQSEFLKTQTTYKTDESLRPGKPKTPSDLFGSCSIM